MRVLVAENYEALSRKGAEIVAAVISEKPDANVLLATGETPMGVYGELAAKCRGTLDTTRLRVFQLDEYVGLDPGDRRSLYRWMREMALDPMCIRAANMVRLNGGAPDLDVVCRAYHETVSRAGGLDLAVLGLGPNGHLGFNEPPSTPDSTTRVVDLTEESLRSNARYWGEKDTVPQRAVTAGMDVLLCAHHILLLVSGEHKRGILRRVVRGPLTPEVPASYLQRLSNVTVLADKAAWDAQDPALPRRK